jgi:tubulin polyglutamylase TTLL6/13
MYALARKNNLARNLMRMQKFFPEDYKFFPQTWLLPAEYGDFRAQFTRAVGGKNSKKWRSGKTFISKPEAAA